MDDEAMLIELELDGLDIVMTGLTQVAVQLEYISRLLRGLRSMQTVQIRLQPVSMGAIASASGASAMSAYSPRAPRARMDPPWTKRLTSFISSMRFGAGGLMPLVGRTLALLPPQLRIAAMAVTALGAAAMAGAEAIRAFRNEQLVSGGTAHETARLRNLGGAVGIENTGQMARELADRLASSGTAAAAGQRIGIHDIGNIYATDQDKAKNLEKVIDYITSATTSDAEARRVAIQLGTEELLRFRDMSREMGDALKDQGNVSAKINDPESARISADFWASIQMLKTALGDLWTQIGKDLLPIMTQFIKYAADFIEEMAEALKIFDDWWNSLFGKQTDKQKDSLDKNTDAIEEHSRILKSGIYGGGAQAGGALPSRYSPQNPSYGNMNPAAMGSFGL